ncbi:MAG TPA: TldD/PmbA family protein [Acholeplasmataceae bacterium]|jgi:TldD protein|nr:TldD/PmbA family protein [Acholeplasmataceae bacterium]
MFSKDKLKEILEISLSTGADFGELFFEKSIKNVYELTKGKVTDALTSCLYGVGIRILRGSEEVYGYSNDLNFEKVKELARKVASGFDGKPLGITFDLQEQNYENKHVVKIKPSDLTTQQKIAYLEQINKGAINYSDEVTQVICTLLDKEQHVTIVNTEGKIAKDCRTNVRIFGHVVASDGKDTQTGSENIGRNQGYEMFDGVDLEAFGAKIAKTAVTMLHADEIAGGKMTVVVHNGFGGVLLHEACVHSLEATSVAKGVSVFSNKLGQKIASDIVTAIDDGTLANNWGSLNVDDEGNPTQRNVLIENGILKSYLVDYRNSRIMKHPITGSGRRESYKYSPTSRMTNTFFAPGKHTFEEIIANTKKGLFAKSMGGGSVDPSTGQFNFAVNEGYLIEDGKITKPVRGATLVGSGAEILLNIDMIANNLSYGHGMCGSLSGSIPTDVGQPTIRVQNLTVGGRG